MEKLIREFDKLTEYEQRVCSFIVQNTDQAFKMNIKELAKETLVSKTVVINTAQKMGFSGFTELKYYLKDIVN